MNRKNYNKKHNKKQNEPIVQCINANISQEKMIDIQAEAYYIALKKIEEENKHKELNKTTQYKWYEKIFLILNIYLFPIHISKKFSINKYIYETAYVLIISSLIRSIGTIGWIIGIYNFIFKTMCAIIENGMNIETIYTILFSICFVVFGSILIISANVFEKEEDSNRIYAYSASILALFSFCISVLTLIL